MWNDFKGVFTPPMHTHRFGLTHSITKRLLLNMGYSSFLHNQTADYLINPHLVPAVPVSLKMDFSLEGTFGKYLKDSLPITTLALSIVLTMTVVLRWLSRGKIPSIPIQMMVGIFLGKSILGRSEISGTYISTYKTLFSIQNQTVFFHIGAFGYLTSVFLIGLKTNLRCPKRSELLLGLIGVLVPFFIGLFIEFFFESKLKLRTDGFRGYGILIFCLSSPSFPSISLLLHDLNLSTESLSQFILSTSLIAEVVTDAFTEILKIFYDRHSHVSSTSTDTFYPLLWLFLFILFAFLFFRPLINLLSKYSSFSHSCILIIFILAAVGLCNTILSDFATGHGIFVTLILGLAVPCFSNLQEMIDQIEEFVKVLLFLYITSLTLTVNVFCINLKKKETILCGILLLGVTTSRFFTIIIMTRKLQSCTWREAWATGLMMTPLGFVELSVFAVARYENVIQDSEYNLLMLSILFSNCMATITRMVYKQSQESDSSESGLQTNVE